MDALFETVLQMSLSATVMALAILLLRPFLRKAPKWLTCLLWALVALRLLCPFTPESQLSLMPDTAPAAQQVISLQPEAPVISIGQTIVVENGQPVHIPTDIPEASFQIHFWMVWVAGIALMLLYLLYSYVSVFLRVRVFFEAEPGVRQCDAIDTPFIFGILRPRIYIPSTLPPEGIPFVVAHERAHLKRRDHLWKPLGFLLLTLHWFNPVLWLSYILLCRDIELACDERVIRTMTPADKLAYSQILLRCSLRQRFVTACPLAFGEVGVKDRIRSILSYKKPAFWIILAALLAGMGLGIFLLTDRPREPEPKAVSFEGLVERVVAGEQLEVQVLGEEYTGTVLVSTKGLEVPILTKGCYIFVSYDPSDLLSDGYVEKVFEVGLLVGGGTVNAETHMEGIVLAAEGDYLQVQVSVGSAAINYYVNRKGHTADPKPGDRVLIRYLPGNDPTRLELVKEIRITGKADWGVTMQVSDVTPTGLTLWIGVASGFPRQLTASDSFTLLNTNGEPIPVLPGETFPGDTYELSGGDTYAVNWETVYGSLAPGQYRLQKAIRHEGEERLVSVDFTVPLPLATELDEAVSQTVRYYISKRLVNPPLHLDKTMEQIPQTEDTGFLDNPTVTLTEGKTYQQIAVSHSIIDRQQFGNEYTLIIAACCRGYNNRQAADSLQCAMRLVIRQNEDGTFTATSCMIPTQLSGQADAELLFGEELARQLREDRMLWDSLENSCDKQVIGGVLTVKGFGQTFAADSMEATLIENAIKAGKKLKKPYEDGYVSTLFVGDTVYYFYFQKGIIHNATEDSYTQLTAEGTQTVNTLFQSAGEQ